MFTTPLYASAAARVAVGVGLVAALVAGCGGDRDLGGDVDDASPASPTASPSPALADSCNNPDDGYRIRYPDGWQTNPGDVISECRLFDPDPIDIDAHTEIPFDIAVQLRVADPAFEEMLDLLEEDIATDVVDRERVEIAGRDALLVDSISTGETLLPEGVRGRTYYVDVDGGTLIATTHDVGEPDFASKRAALDAMVQTLDFPTEPGGS